MAEVYADLIMEGLKKLEDVPDKIREDVKNVLKKRGYFAA